MGRTPGARDEYSLRDLAALLAAVAASALLAAVRRCDARGRAAWAELCADAQPAARRAEVDANGEHGLGRGQVGAAAAVEQQRGLGREDGAAGRAVPREGGLVVDPIDLRRTAWEPVDLRPRDIDGRVFGPRDFTGVLVFVPGIGHVAVRVARGARVVQAGGAA